MPRRGSRSSPRPTRSSTWRASRKDLVGQIQRADGSTQLTLAGWPLYRNRDDDGTLTNAGHNGEDGTWFVVNPTGGQAAPP